MGHVDKRDPEFTLKARKHSLHTDNEVGVEGAHRFVEQQDPGLGNEGAGKCDALALPSRKLRHIALRELRDVEPFQPLKRLRAPVLRVHAAHLQTKLDIAAHGEEWKERKGLPHHRCIPFPGTDFVHPAAGKSYLPFARRVESRQHAQRRGFSAPARSHDGEELPLADFEIHALNRHGFAKALDDILEHDERFRHARSPGS